MKIKITLIITSLFILNISSSGQSENVKLSLQECIQIAVEQNINMDKARLDKEKSGYKVTEVRSAYLPKIEASGSFQNNVKLPVTILPGDFMGTPGTYMPLKMGIRYSTSIGVSANQLIYSQTAISSIQLSKKAGQLSEMNIEKAREDLAYEIAKLYFLAQTTVQQKEIIKDNISRLERLAGITKLIIGQGLGKQVDYDRIHVNLENLHTELNNTEALHQQQINMMKYMLEMPIDSDITLTDTVSMELLANQPGDVTDFTNLTDLRMLAMQTEIEKMNQKVIWSGYLPTLAAFGQWNYLGMRDKFSDYFHSGPTSDWYSSTYIGLSLNIPIFNGLDKRSKSRQAKVDYQKSVLTYDNTLHHYQINYRNAMNNYFNNKVNVERQMQNIELAEKVYHETTIKYREGLSTLSDLLQDETSLSTAQSGYLNALYQFKVAELDIMTLNGEITRLAGNKS